MKWNCVCVMLMSFRVDDGVWQLCGQKILLNILYQIHFPWAAGGVGLVVNSLDLISLFKGSRFKSCGLSIESILLSSIINLICILQSPLLWLVPLSSHTQLLLFSFSPTLLCPTWGQSCYIVIIPLLYGLIAKWCSYLLLHIMYFTLTAVISLKLM